MTACKCSPTSPEDAAMLQEVQDLAGDALQEDENQAERSYFDELDASQAQLDFADGSDQVCDPASR